jgi:hypothetical protein
MGSLMLKRSLSTCCGNIEHPNGTLALVTSLIEFIAPGWVKSPNLAASFLLSDYINYVSPKSDDRFLRSLHRRHKAVAAGIPGMVAAIANP